VTWVVVQVVISGTGIAYWRVWSESIRNVRLAALDLEGDLRDGSWWSQSQNRDSEDLGFT